MQGRAGGMYKPPCTRPLVKYAERNVTTVCKAKGEVAKGEVGAPAPPCKIRCAQQERAVPSMRQPRKLTPAGEAAEKQAFR